jgi:hypothetical protein
VLDRRLLELIPIDSVTLSNEYGHGERAHCRRSSGKSQSSMVQSEPDPNGRSVAPIVPTLTVDPMG